MNILLIETATSVCSVALVRDGKAVSELHSSEPNAHSAKLSVLIDSLMDGNSIRPHDLDAVCVSSGPGSYTGLRIGVSTAKGFCYALKKPLLSVPTLRSMADLFYMQHPGFEGMVCPMIDARRMECYAAIFSRQGVEKETGADIIEPGIYDAWLDRGEVAFVGDGAAKTRDILGSHPNARFFPDFQISALGMADLSIQLLSQGKAEDVAYFEPFYLKDFVAKKPVVKGLK